VIFVFLPLDNRRTLTNINEKLHLDYNLLKLKIKKQKNKKNKKKKKIKKKKKHTMGFLDETLTVVSHPMLVLGDFNTHSQSMGCDSEDSSALAVQCLFDGLNLVHLN
jgi:hypothetical protein